MSAVLVAVVTYICVGVFYRHKTAVAALGAGAIVLLGHYQGFYHASIASQKIPVEVLILILVLSIFSKDFENRGILAFLGAKATNMGRGRRHLIMAILLFSTYVFSLFANNLGVALVFTVVCLRLGIVLRMPIAPLLIGTVISCNIGGCPLPWADTPAMILSIYTDFDIIDFLSYLFPVCTLFALMLIAYAFRKTKTCSGSPSRPEELLNLECMRFVSRFERVRWKGAILPGILFLLLLTGLSLGPLLSLPVWVVAISSGAFLLLSKGKEAAKLLDITGLMDTIVFISALFVIAGALEASGIINMLVAHLENMSTISAVLPAMCILLLAFILATFLSAGPAAATLLPICLGLSALGGKTIYAALALGILAGSSMLPWSATGGPIMVNEAARYLEQEEIDDSDRANVEKLFKLGPYIRFSMPFCMLMLTLSALWLYFLFLVRGHL